MYFSSIDTTTEESLLHQSLSLTSSPTYREFLFDWHGGRSSIPSAASDVQPCLNDLEKQLHVVVLQNCLDRLHLLMHVFPLDDAVVMRVKRQCDYVSLVDRMEGGFEDENQAPTNLIKFQRDLYLLCHLIKKAMNEVFAYGNYSRFADKIQGIHRKKEDEEVFSSQFTFNSSYRCELKELIAKERKEFREQLAAMNKRVAEKEVEFGHQKNIMRSKARYLDKWEKSRQSQNELKLATTCDDYERTIRGYRKKIKLEIEAHTKIDTFMQEQCEEYQNDVENWMNVYQDELEKRDMDIYNLKARKELLGERFVALQRQYEERKIAIAEWLAYKEVKRKEEAERLRLENAATKIQAWWRGVMVRRCLGRFRKKKKKGKKGKKDTKNKPPKPKPKPKK